MVRQNEIEQIIYSSINKQRSKYDSLLLLHDRHSSYYQYPPEQYTIACISIFPEAYSLMWILILLWILSMKHVLSLLHYSEMFASIWAIISIFCIQMILKRYKRNWRLLVFLISISLDIDMITTEERHGSIANQPSIHS